MDSKGCDTGKEGGGHPVNERHNTPSEAVRVARSAFLRDDNYYGCAESTLVALQSIFGLPQPEDSSAAMALNGGIAYSGGMCGAISGAAMALGRLAELRLDDHRQAKRTARLLTQQLIADFEAEFSSSNCRDLIDYKISIPAEHDAFIASDVWRTTCMRQIEFSVDHLARLAVEQAWNETLDSLDD
jgi:C_GCAxxG_C_C family probable redox protein